MTEGEDLRVKRRLRGVIVGAVVVVVLAVAVLRLLGLVLFFAVNANSMRPAISRGDQYVMEGLTFMARAPRRGDVIVMRTDGLPSLSAGGVYIKRIVGEPGERLRLWNGELYVNGRHVSLRNAAGEIHYQSVAGERQLTSNGDLVTVPADHYFVVGDNSAESADSRIWGSLPKKNIVGRPWLRYWPLRRVGRVK